MQAAERRDERTPFDAVLLYVFTGVMAFVSLLAAAFTEDPLFRFHAYIALTLAVIALAAITLGINSGKLRSDPTRYADDVVRAGVIATMFWAVVGLLVGVVIAAQLSWPRIFYFPEFGWLNFGRLRPLHTSGVIFAFGGNALICTSFWVVQRTCKAMHNRIWPIALAAIFAASLAQAADAPDDHKASVEKGRVLVERNCGMCHATGEKGESPNAKAPPFRDLNERFDVDALGEGLAQGILTGHPAMPEFRFQPHEIVSIVLYLKTVQARRTASAAADPLD